MSSQKVDVPACDCKHILLWWRWIWARVASRALPPPSRLAVQQVGQEGVELPVGVGHHGPLLGDDEPDRLRVELDHTIHLIRSLRLVWTLMFYCLSSDEERTVLVPWLLRAARRGVREGS